MRIGPHVFIERDTRVAEDVRIAKGAVLGSDPQDLKYAGERTFLEIGPRTVVREFTTLNGEPPPAARRRWGRTAS